MIKRRVVLSGCTFILFQPSVFKNLPPNFMSRAAAIRMLPAATMYQPVST